MATATMVTNRTSLYALNGRHTRYSITSPLNVSAIMHIAFMYCPNSSSNAVPTIYIDITHKIISTPPATARLMTWVINLPCTRALFGCNERKKEGTPITHTSRRSTFEGMNRYAFPINMHKAASMVVNSVFMRYSDDEFLMLFITRLPSATIFGIELKLLSIKTRWLTFLAASLPEATDIAQSASFRASMSFTPSPVIATVFPSDFIARTSIAFCSGVTLPNTVYLFATFSTSLSFSPSSEMNFSAPSIPARRATSETVTGLSPEITFTATSFSLNHFMVEMASSRMLSAMEIIATGLIIAGSLSPTMGAEECASTKTRMPICAYCFIILSTFAGRGFKTNSGAP